MSTQPLSMLLLVPLVLTLTGTSRGADPLVADAGPPVREVLGTIEATMDGTSRTWYVVAGPAADGPYSSAVWMDLPGGPVGVLGGLDEAEPGISGFSRGSADLTVPPSLGSYSGSALNLLVPVAPGRYAVGDGSGRQQVLYLPDAGGTDPTAMFRMVEGELVVEEAGMADGTARLRGTWSGRLERSSDGAAMTVSSGVFDVRDVPAASAIQPGP